MPDQRHVPGLAPPSPRDEEIRVVVAELVDNYAWAEARAILTARLREIVEIRQTHLERLFLAWSELPEPREDFLTFAHPRRRQELGHG